jgi:uncharacterized protein YkwD
MGKIIRTIWIAGAISIAGGAVAGASASAADTTTDRVQAAGSVSPQWITHPEGAEAEMQMLGYLNEYRLENGLKALVRIPTLDGAAREWSAFMAERGCVERDGTSLCHRRDLPLLASMASPKGWTRAGENVGRVPDGGTLASLHQAFTNSAAHRANMLNSQYNAVGVGVSFDTNGMLYITFEYLSTVGVPNSAGPVIGFPEVPVDASQEDAFLFYVNFLRSQSGLKPLVRQAVLDREATWWSQQRVAGACGPDTNLCNRRDSAAMIKAAVGSGKTRWWAGAVGITYASDASAQVSWFASSAPLRAVLMRKDANLLGVGFAQNEEGQHFITISVLQVTTPTRTLPASSTKPLSTNTCGWIYATLKARQKGVTVRVAQCALAAQGLWTGPVDGYYSADMVTAVKDFQRSHSIRATGTLDARTRRALGVI